MSKFVSFEDVKENQKNFVLNKLRELRFNSCTKDGFCNFMNKNLNIIWNNAHTIHLKLICLRYYMIKNNMLKIREIILLIMKDKKIKLWHKQVIKFFCSQHLPKNKEICKEVLGQIELDKKTESQISKQYAFKIDEMEECDNAISSNIIWDGTSREEYQI